MSRRSSRRLQGWWWGGKQPPAEAGGFSLNYNMANFLRFTKAREISRFILVGFGIHQAAVVPVYTGGLLSPAAIISSGAAFVCDRASASPSVRPDRSGKTQTAEPFQNQYSTIARLLPWINPEVSGAEVLL